MSELLKPPEVVRGQTILNKQAFKKIIEIPVVTVDKTKVSNVLLVLKKYCLKIDNFKPVQSKGESFCEVYLNPTYINDFTSFPHEVQSKLVDQNVTEKDLRKEKVALCYENFSSETILRAVLPSDKEGLASFSVIGHIVHVNLREHLLPYKMLIGEVLFDKIHGCRTVVNKTNNINNTYRNFEMEVLKGEDNMLTSVKEGSCIFMFDFSKVYWNSRLNTEHERVIQKLNKNDVLFDVFAGVGPFAIPSAKNKCYVYANDLNPDSFKWLNHNAQLNKIDDQYLRCYNKDGKDFIKEIIKEYLPIHLKNIQNIAIVMNLPALAVQFLPFFVGLFNPNELQDFQNAPVIIVYCFAKGEDYRTITEKLVTSSFGFDMKNYIMDIFRVRTVSSMKEMMKVTIKLDRDILVANVKKRKFGEICETENKKHAVNENETE